MDKAGEDVRNLNVRRYLIRKGTVVYMRGTKEHQLRRDIVLSYEVVEPLRQFPPEVLAARTAIGGSKFYKEKLTRLFVATAKLWPAHPNCVLAVHEEDLNDYHD